MIHGHEASGLEKWYRSREGAYTLERQKLLLAHMISPWPRRGTSLVQIGSGSGRFLDFFWESGFDVTGVESDPDLLAEGSARMGGRVDLRMAPTDHLPFGDNEFDYAVVMLSPCLARNPVPTLTEAVRVAERGMIVLFLNTWSLFFAEQAIRRMHAAIRQRIRRDHVPACWSNPWRTAWNLRKVSGKFPVAYRSVLFLPSALWGRVDLIHPFVSKLQVIPLGAIAAARLDKNPVGVTPILVPVRSPAQVIQ